VRFRNLLLSAGLILIVSYSCKEKGGKFINQGEIHYSIEYIKSTSSFGKDLLPRNLIISFKEDKILFEILAPIGNSGIINLVNPEVELYDTYYNFMGTKYYYAGKPGEIHPGFAAMDGMELRKTNKTTAICGYNCKNAEVTFPSDRGKVYDIWYTNEIKVKNSNLATPYTEIDGVLMSFVFFLGKSEMQFEAEAVYKKDLPDKTFERRPKYKLVAKKDLDKLIVDMINL
jgi:hypothetical protein